jgi:hypothetical protein
MRPFERKRALKLDIKHAKSQDTLGDDCSHGDGFRQAAGLSGRSLHVGVICACQRLAARVYGLNLFFDRNRTKQVFQ